MGWARDEARAVKAEAAARVREVLDSEPTVEPTASPDDEPGVGGRGRAGVAVGLSPQGDGTFGLAVRYDADTPAAQAAVARLREQYGDDLDVRPTGPVTPLIGVVPTAQATGQTGRVRPVQPGVSVANVAVTAGTVAGFVDVDGTVFALSNFHVLVGDAGAVGDAVLQPGPADGGVDPQDRIGTLASFAPLTAGQPATVDAALATLDDAAAEVADGPAFDPTYPPGALVGVAEVDGGEQVEKIGRTTGLTQGVVTAIELDGVQVDFGPVFGVLTFDGQIEVESSGTGPFSQGGDSGSLIYRPDTREAVGLLFAGGDQGGSNGLGLTYLNPIGVVLEALGGTLVLSAEQTPPGEDAEERGPVDDVLAAAREAAERIREGVLGLVSGARGVTGVGLTREGDGYGVVVNVTDDDAAQRLPQAVRDRATIRTTGPIQAQGDTGDGDRPV